MPLGVSRPQPTLITQVSRKGRSETETVCIHNQLVRWEEENHQPVVSLQGSSEEARVCQQQMRKSWAKHIWGEREIKKGNTSFNWIYEFYEELSWVSRGKNGPKWMERGTPRNVYVKSSHSNSRGRCNRVRWAKMGSRGQRKAEHCCVSMRPKKVRPLGSAMERLLFTPEELAEWKEAERAVRGREREIGSHRSLYILIFLTIIANQKKKKS